MWRTTYSIINKRLYDYIYSFVFQEGPGAESTVLIYNYSHDMDQGSHKSSYLKHDRDQSTLPRLSVAQTNLKYNPDCFTSPNLSYNIVISTSLPWTPTDTLSAGSPGKAEENYIIPNSPPPWLCPKDLKGYAYGSGVSYSCPMIRPNYCRAWGQHGRGLARPSTLTSNITYCQTN